MRSRSVLALLATACAAVGLAGCGDSSDASATETTTTTQAQQAPTPVLLSADDARSLIESGDAVVLDVRTPEEFDEGHLAGATLIDFYEPDFAQRIAELDPDATYVVYCRSGNRSGQAVALMAQQGFSSVNDVDGGVQAWEAAGLPLER